MNVEVISKLLGRFVRRHKTSFEIISQRQSMLLELGTVVGIQEHYRSRGFSIELIQPPGLSKFRVKTSTRGWPWNYTRIRASRGVDSVDIHMNLMVRGAHDQGIYCVDVGITRPESVPMAKPTRRWACLENRHLYSFAEAKRLVVYPMLLAQFFGIVHEIKPRFLRPPARRRYGSHRHPPPTLIVLGNFSGTSSVIVESYEKRGCQLNVAEKFDLRVAWASKKASRSPLYWSEAKARSSRILKPKERVRWFILDEEE